MSRIDVPRAVVISYNWLTMETMHSQFEGEYAGSQAAGWVHKKSFLWKDFPERDGWVHFSYMNDLAGKIRGKEFSDELMNKGTITVRVPT